MTTSMRKGTGRSILTPRGLAALRTGEWVADPASRGVGRLQARRLATGAVVFYFRYTAPDGTRVRLPIGTFDNEGRDGLTLLQARERAGELSRRYQAGQRDLRHALGEEQREALARRDALAKAAEVEATRCAGTLGTLLTLYCDALEREEKPSASQVRAMIERHVKTANPRLWVKPALDILPADGVEIIGALISKGKVREPGKLRAALRAAFSLAIRAHGDPRLPDDLRRLAIRSNPMAEIAAMGGGTGQRDRALSLAELRAYWSRVNALAEPTRALLRFHLLTGGQRHEQLARVTTDSVDRDAKLFTLLDGKGRRKTPRRHAVPLLPEAMKAIDVMTPLGPFLFSVDGGLSGAAYNVLAKRVRDVSSAMVKAREADKRFTPGDLRRTVETRLASVGISSDVRARLQSHGLGGVQARHYDRHDYAKDMRVALTKLRALLVAKKRVSKKDPNA